MNAAYIWIWYVFETGVSKRPSGFTLHQSPEEAKRYCDTYAAKLGPLGSIVGEYDAPGMNGYFMIEVDDAVADQLAVSPTIRVWEHEKQYRLVTGRMPRPHLVTYVPAMAGAAL